MLSKISALWRLMKVGEAVADPAKWKLRQITVTALAAVLVAAANAAHAYGLALPMDAEAANSIAAGVLAVWNIVLTVATTKRAGLPPDGNGAVGSTDASPPGAAG